MARNDLSTKPRNTPVQFIINAIRFVLEKNAFDFRNRTLLQILGTAMEHECAPHEARQS